MKPKKLVWCGRLNRFAFKWSSKSEDYIYALRREECEYYCKKDRRCDINTRRPCIGVEGEFTPNEGGAK